MDEAQSSACRGSEVDESRDRSATCTAALLKPLVIDSEPQETAPAVLTSAAKRELKARAHALKPVVLVGQRGVTPAVIASVDEALNAHELIKLRLPAGERADRVAQADAIAAQLQAEVVASIGLVVVLYRPRPA